MSEIDSEDAGRLRKEVLLWKRRAAYLAECHAATLEHEGSFGSCSARSRERYVHICEIAADMLEGRRDPLAMDREGVEVHAAERCREAVKEARK